MDSTILLLFLLCGILIAAGVYSLVLYYQRVKAEKTRLLLEFVILLPTLFVLFTLAYFLFDSWVSDFVVGIWYLILASSFCISLNVCRIIAVRNTHLKNNSGLFYSLAIGGCLLLSLLFYFSVKFVDV